MLWHRLAIFQSKGNKFSSSAECRFEPIGSQTPNHEQTARWQTEWAIEDQDKNLKLKARPYDQQPFSPLEPTASWLSPLVLAIYMLFVVNFDALAQASDIRIKSRQVVFLCWIQDSNRWGLRNQIASRLNAHWQTDWAIEDQDKNLNLTARPYDHSTQPTRTHWQFAFAPGPCDIEVCYLFPCSGTSKRFFNRKQTICFPLQDSNSEGLWNRISSRLNARWQTDWAIEEQAKNCRLAFATGSGNMHNCCC